MPGLVGLDRESRGGLLRWWLLSKHLKPVKGSPEGVERGHSRQGASPKPSFEA